MNNQPAGFYAAETLKQDVRRFGVPFLNPCVDRSASTRVPETTFVALGLQLLKGVGRESARFSWKSWGGTGPAAAAQTWRAGWA